MWVRVSLAPPETNGECPQININKMTPKLHTSEVRERGGEREKEREGEREGERREREREREGEGRKRKINKKLIILKSMNNSTCYIHVQAMCCSCRLQ